MPGLLLDEEVRLISRKLIAVVGLDGAVLLQGLADNAQGQDGYYSYEDLRLLACEVNPKRIKRTISHLQRLGVLQVEEYGKEYGVEGKLLHCRVIHSALDKLYVEHCSKESK